MDRKTAVIVGLARDIAGDLPYTLRNIERLATLFSKVSFVFFENDSKDGTLKILQDWAVGRDCHVLSELGIHGNFAIRTQRTAYCRSKLQAFAFQHYIDRDYIVMLDMDRPARFIDMGGVEQALAYIDGEPSVGAVFANSLPFYYDLWALRHERWCPDDCWLEVDQAMTAGESFADAERRIVSDRQHYLAPSSPPFQVGSAFNVLGIYRARAFWMGRFMGMLPNGIPIVEHTPFSVLMTKHSGLSLMIFPAMVTSPYEWMERLLRKAPDHIERVCKRVTRMTEKRKQASFIP